MKRFHTFTLAFISPLLLIYLACSSPATAQGTHDHHGAAHGVGRVSFPVTCSEQSRTSFNRAVAWLHSFEYEEAEKAFTEITVSDPKCGMAYWGIAMSNYHPLWAPPTPAELQKGRVAVEKAEAVSAQTERERGYIAAIRAFYADSDKVPHRTRSSAYSDAMADLHSRHPADNEAAVFYALALIAKGMTAADKSYVNEKKAAEILNRVLAVEPEHPGVTHYLIHGYDFPALAHHALPAARSYAKIAPASSHAQHMPSHIFTRLGLWQEAIASNIAARDSAKAYAVRHKLPGAWDEQLHAMDYLAYAYLQGAQDKQVQAVMSELSQIRRVDPPNLKVAYSSTAIPARYALERRQWAEAAKLQMPAHLEGFPWQNFPWAEAHVRFARAVGAARTGNVELARLEVEKLTGLRQALVDGKGDYDWGKQVQIQHRIASAWLAYATGDHSEAVKMMRSAADLDDATEKHPVTPGTVLPAREQLGELYLELKQPAAALSEFESGLNNTPNRFNALYGAARAAKSAGDREKAMTYYAKLVEVSRVADTLRPEIKEAKSFLNR